MKRIVIVSDLQVPFHDRHAVKNLASFISKFKPHEVVTIGDEIDFNTISNIEKDVAKPYNFRTCNICGCKQYTTNFARYSRTKKHKEADYAVNKFEIEKYEPQPKKNNDYIILG